MLIITPSYSTEFLKNSQIKTKTPKKQHFTSDDTFDEMLSEEIRRLDVNYIKAMGILKGGEF